MKTPFPQLAGRKVFLPAVILFSSFVFIQASFSATKTGNKSILPAKQSGFQTGFDAQKSPSWSEWKPFSALPDALGPQERINTAPPLATTKSMALGNLDRYQTSAQDEPVSIAVKADDILGNARDTVVSMAFGDPRTQNLVGAMMSHADEMSSETDRVYAEVHGMYSEIDAMKGQLASNYDVYNKSAKGDAEAKQFNSQSDAMADRVNGMLSAVEGMHDSVAGNIVILDGMSDVLTEMADNSKNDTSYYDKVYAHLKDVSARFDKMAKDLAAQDAADPASLEKAKQYLLALQDYVKGHRPYADSQADYLNNVNVYIGKIKKYLQQVLADLDKTKTDLTATEQYFRNAKVDPQGSSAPIAAPADAANICANSEVKGLSSLKDCQKSCHTVCRWKEKVEGADCYECPSGSPDSCYDVGAWPDNHPWCQPGGICHDDPMMYCAPFGTISPTNKEKLSCTVCKKRDDMCWQKVGDGTTTYTNCKMGCWNGKCVYKGKYQEFEWDGSKENIHCYKCELPPPPPQCEDMGWGTTWKSDCEKNCPDPGQCEKVNSKVPGPVPPPGNNPPPGGPQNGQPPAGGQPQNGGPQDGPAQGGDNSGGTQSGGNASGGNSGGEPANPPTGTPTQPGSGGSVAGGGTPPPAGPSQPGTATPQGGDNKPQQAPGTTEPTQPTQPNTGDKPKPPEPPPAPPDTPQISFYKEQLAKTEERIKSREDIINNPNEPESVKQMAREQLESMTRQRDKDKANLEDEQRRELEKIKNEEERKKRLEEWERTRPRTPDYAEEARKRGEAWLLNQLKNATKALQDKLTEARDVINGRRERLEKIRNEIAQLENENKYFTESGANGNLDSDFTKTRVKQNQDRINELKRQYAEFDKKLKEAITKYNEELERVKSDYRRALWAYDKKSQARADAERTDEYFESYSELQHKKTVREERNRTFNEVATGLESAIRDKKAKGEDAGDLERQLDNLKRGQAEWDESMQRQEDAIGRHLYELERRNFYEGAGPSSPDSLGERLTKYGNEFQKQLADTQKMIADLEKNTTRTKEQNDLLNTLKSKVGDLQNSITAVAEKQSQFKGGTLTADEQQRIHDTTLRVANGAMSTDADKSFARLALESIGEEAVHNLNPYVAAKKTLAFGVGVVQGVGSAVKGLVELGVGAVDLTMEVYLTNLGFDIETDSLDALNSMISTVSTNANFDGVLKAVVAAGGAIDAKINELGKGDIDWNTSKFGGDVLGQTVVGDMVIGAGLGKAGKALGLVEDAADVGRVGAKIEDAADAGRTGSKVGEIGETGSAASKLNETQKFPPFEPPGAGAADETAAAGRTAGKAGEAPHGPTTGETPPSRAPPETKPVEIEVPKSGPADAPATPGRGGVNPNSTTTYTGPDGKPVTLQTGKELGHGSTSVVYEDATNAKKAIRITEPGKGGIETAPVLDRVGREAVEKIQSETSSIRIAEKGNPTMVRDPNSPLNGKIVEVVERVEGGSADKLLNGGPMSQAQAEAFDRATRELNEAGYVWMDNHTGNYGFEKMKDGRLRVVVLDPGGIVPMQGGSLVEKADNARALQTHINVRDPETAEFVKMAQEKRQAWQAKNPGVERGKDMLDNVIDSERSIIMRDFGDKIDTAAMGLKDPSQIAYYPYGTLEHPNVQALGKMTPAESAAYYGIKK